MNIHLELSRLCKLSCFHNSVLEASVLLYSDTMSCCDEFITFQGNVSKILPNDTASCPKRVEPLEGFVSNKILFYCITSCFILQCHRLRFKNWQWRS